MILYWDFELMKINFMLYDHYQNYTFSNDHNTEND